MKRITMTLAVFVMFIISVQGQGFLNLNFESAQNLPGNPGNGVFVSVTNALPSWTAYEAEFALSDVFFVSNNISGSAAPVELVGGSLALSGNYSVELFADGSISQTGLVSATAESLEFEANVPGAAVFSVTLGGQSLSYSAISEGSDYTVYGASIPAGMAGQTETLNFGCQGPGSGMVVLDNIDFSPESIPEPGEFALIGLGALLLATHKSSSAGRRSGKQIKKLKM